MVMEGNKSAWRFDPSKSADELLQAVTDAVRVDQPEAASVLSLQTLCTDSTFEVTNVPRPRRGGVARPPAVAGAFYPGDPGEISRQLDAMLTNGKERQSWPAAMVPHAGWRFSGRVAGQVFQQLEFPETIIVFAPKHTRPGMDWAVAPHEVWQLPGQSINSDPDLAQRLSTAIDGLEMDAQAHVQEHAIEVQLPFLARLAPQSRVVGITIGGGTLSRCQAFARGLASVVEKMERPPLLVVSTDMNHYASDDENRRLDAIALDAVETLNPADVFNTVTKNEISMCGMRPTVIVMETLRQLGQLSKCRRVAYTTSAEASGDKRQVVGYAGMLFG
jgi:AmmeMemoRadiSam system protein B